MKSRRHSFLASSPAVFESLEDRCLLNGLSGTYHMVSFSENNSGGLSSPSFTETRGTLAFSSDTDFTGDFTLVGHSDGPATSEQISGTYSLDDLGTFTVGTQNGGAMIGTVSADQSLLAMAQASSSSDNESQIGIAMKEASGLSNASLNGKFNFAFYQTNGNEGVTSGIGTISFNGSGGWSGTMSATAQGQSDSNLDPNDPGSGSGTYTVSSDGTLTVSMGGSPIWEGFISADGKTIAWMEEPDGNSTGIGIAAKQASGFTSSAAKGSYAFAGFCADGTTEFTSSYGAAQFFGNGQGTASSSTMSNNDADSPYNADFTVTVNGNGQLSLPGSTNKGFFSADGSLLVMALGATDADLETAFTVGISTPYDSSSGDLSDVPFFHLTDGLINTFNGQNTFAGSSYTFTSTAVTFLGINAMDWHSTAVAEYDQPEMEMILAKDTSGRLVLLQSSEDGNISFQAQSLSDAVLFSNADDPVMRMFGHLASGSYKAGDVCSVPGNGSAQIMSTSATLPQFPGQSLVLVKRTSDGGNISWIYFHPSVGIVADLWNTADTATGDGWILQGWPDSSVDLTGSIGTITAPDPIVPGDKVKVPVTITNSGLATAKGTISVELDLIDSNQTPNWVGEIDDLAINLAPGKSITVTFNSTVYASVNEGYYNFAADINEYEDVAESNFANNLVQDDTQREVSWSFGTVTGLNNAQNPRKNVSMAVWDDLDDHMTTLSLSGPVRAQRRTM